MKHATVQRDGFVVPLIGIAPDAVLQDCDCCGDTFPIREVEWSGKQMLCPKCRKQSYEETNQENNQGQNRPDQQ